MLFNFGSTIWKADHSRLSLSDILCELEALHSVLVQDSQHPTSVDAVRADLAHVNALIRTNRRVRDHVTRAVCRVAPHLTYMLSFLPATEPRFRGSTGREYAPVHDGPTQVRQGQLGDCWFVATLAACEHTKPGFVSSLIENGPDAVSVRLFSPGALRHLGLALAPVLPRQRTRTWVTRWVPQRHRAGDDDLGANNASLVEKAAASFVRSYARLQFNFAGTAFWILTGRHCPARPVPHDLGVVRDWLEAGRPVVASTLVHPRGARRLPREDDPDRWVGIMAGHVYVVHSVGRFTEDGVRDDRAQWRIHLHNPLGGREGEPRRTDVFLSARQFRRAFLSVNVGPVLR